MNEKAYPRRETKKEGISEGETEGGGSHPSERMEGRMGEKGTGKGKKRKGKGKVKSKKKVKE